MMQLQMTHELQIQTLIHATLSCISYLRDLFDENCFFNETFCNVTIKSLKKGVSSSSDKLLNWLERGCYDAINKKYLKSLTIGIYLNENLPKRVSEIYTFEIKYDKEEENNPESISKLIRTLCLLTQSLQPLPRIKYLTLKLFYNKDTPVNYEPEFFKPAGKHEFEFISEPLKLDVGSINVNRSEALLKIFTLFDYSNKMETDQMKYEIGPSILSTPKNIILDNLNKSESQVSKKSFSISHSSSINECVKKIKKEKIVVEQKQEIKCICESNFEDNDMIKCDRCQGWLHTVCCGYFSNNDRRIPKGEFVCDICKKSECRDDLFLIAYQRRILSVIYNEGLTNVNNIVSRLRLRRYMVQKIRSCFISEGFIVLQKGKYEVIRNNETKIKIKRYFSITTLEDRASIPISDIKCIRSD